MNTSNLTWKRLSLPGQFLLAGAAVMLAAMLSVGIWVSSRIEQAVVQNSATSAALFMESFISPLSQELADSDALSLPAERALSEIFAGTVLGERVVSYKIWKKNGLIVHASNNALVGRNFEPSEDLKLAWQGRIAAAYADLNDIEDENEAALGIPLLEVYSPIREVWTGEVIAVAEFYERADALKSDLSDAKRKSWLVVGAVFLASGLLLFGIVEAGGRTINRQREELGNQLDMARAMSLQNAQLRKRAVSASARATAQTERTFRRIGSDLHDGPAQHLALAALRLDGVFRDSDEETAAAGELRMSLDHALKEIRSISRGLALPDLDNLDIRSLIERAVKDHAGQTGADIELTFSGTASSHQDYAKKLCVFRFLQETLSNASRHARASRVSVGVVAGPQDLHVSVEDDGVGFDQKTALKIREDGGQGLLGLIDRAESIGGEISIDSKAGSGTRVTLTLPLQEART